MSKVRYSRIPTDNIDDDAERIDFSSPFTFDSATTFDASRYSDPSKKESIYEFTRQKVMAQTEVEREQHSPSMIQQMLDFIVITLAVIVIILTSPISCWFCFKKIKGNQRALVYRLGRKRDLQTPGILLVIPFIDRVTLVDVSTKAFNIPPQMTCTQDRAIIQLGAEVQYSVKDAELSVTATQDSKQYLRSVAQTSLVNNISARDLKQITNDRLGLSYDVQKELNTTASNWGLLVDRVELSHVQVLQEPDPEPSAIQAILSRAHIATPPGMPGFPQLMEQMIQSPHMKAVMESIGKSEAAAQPGMKQVMEAWERAAITQHEQPGPSREQTEPVTSHGQTEASDMMPGGSQMCTLDDLLTGLRSHVTADVCQSINCCMNLTVETADDPVLYHVDMRPESVSIGRGHVTCGCCVRIRSEDLVSLISGQLSPTTAYFTGQIQVEGELRDAITVGKAVSDIWHNSVLRQLPSM